MIYLNVFFSHLQVKLLGTYYFLLFIDHFMYKYNYGLPLFDYSIVFNNWTTPVLRPRDIIY